MSQTKLRLTDLNVIVSGQGGDGSLTVINILADVLRTSGLRIYTERDVLSRIRAALLRQLCGPMTANVCALVATSTCWLPLTCLPSTSTPTASMIAVL